MEYQDFLNKLILDLKKRFPNAEFDTEDVRDVNGEQFKGLGIRIEKDTMTLVTDPLSFYKSLVSHNVELDSEEYQAAFEGFIQLITNYAYTVKPAVSEKDIGKYEKIKPRLLIQLIGKNQMPKDQLDEIIHTEVYGMEAIYLINLGPLPDKMLNVAMVSDCLLKQYGITKETLHKDAMKAMEESTEMGFVPVQEGEYKIISAMGLFGTSAMLYADALEDFAKRLGKTYYLFPANSNELYIFSAKSFSALDIREMIEETFRDISDKRSILSTDIFRYDSDTKKLTVA